ncbi:MAG: M24 family metallopeptidase [Planctomycetota bacterium]
MGTTARLIYDDSERSADLYYLTGFLAGDPFLLLEIGGRRVLVLSDLEVDRARRTSRVDEILRIQEVTDAIKKAEGDAPVRPIARLARIVRWIAADRGIDAFDVPLSFPVGLADALRGAGLGVGWKEGPFGPQRTRKTPDEVQSSRAAVRHTEAAMRAAIDRIAKAKVRGDGLHEGSEPLTSEAVKRTIRRELLDRECDPYDLIVGGGEQAVDPHDCGSGPLPAHLPIILDIFPRHPSSRYHGDVTRTVVRGRPSAEVKRMFRTVLDAKGRAESLLRAGADGQEVHAEVQQVFVEAGFESGHKDGRMVGFFHGTGHGLGLDIHEHPRVSKVQITLEAGNVVTVEPGLYYPGVGGVRVEDDVVVTGDGCENLCELEAVLEI